MHPQNKHLILKHLFQTLIKTWFIYTLPSISLVPLPHPHSPPIVMPWKSNGHCYPHTYPSINEPTLHFFFLGHKCWVIKWKLRKKSYKQFKFRIPLFPWPGLHSLIFVYPTVEKPKQTLELFFPSPSKKEQEMGFLRSFGFQQHTHGHEKQARLELYNLTIWVWITPGRSQALTLTLLTSACSAPASFSSGQGGRGKKKKNS